MPSVDADMQAYYAARAPYYDAVYEKPERRADIAFLKDYLASRFHGRRVIEVACGTGYWTQFLAPVARRWVATDAAPEPLDFAKLRPDAASAEFLQADAYQLPTSLGSFDSAFAGLWLSHVLIGERSAFIRSLHALLEPGAQVVWIDNSEVQCLEFPLLERDAEGNTYQHRPLRDGSTHRVLKNFPTEVDLHSMIEGFGVNGAFRSLDNFWLFEYQVGLSAQNAKAAGIC